MSMSFDLPACQQPAVVATEAYSPRQGRMHGSLDAAVYTCPDHGRAACAAIHAQGMSAYPLDGEEPGDRTCGHVFDFTSIRSH
jgi:hypothetical protein